MKPTQSKIFGSLRSWLENVVISFQLLCSEVIFLKYIENCEGISPKFLLFKILFSWEWESKQESLFKSLVYACSP